MSFARPLSGAQALCPLRLIVDRLRSDLALRAIPGSPAADTGLLDGVTTPEARLAVAAVDPELGLHLSGGAVRVAVVAKRRALAVDAAPEGALDPPHERLQLSRV